MPPRAPGNARRDALPASAATSLRWLASAPGAARTPARGACGARAQRASPRGRSMAAGTGRRDPPAGRAHF